ncbi:MAG TPA: phenylalanine--tRNA ligase subunit beta [Acidimicrobiales bacterium]|nr:phenylalanine--tRNA ligase subunit beta [Acidimicrobiales bacterium]
MRIPLSWLRDFAPIEGSTAELTDHLNELGLVVDAVEEVGAGLDRVVVARVMATRPHPDADRVQLVDVDAGDGQALQIVCGAFNFAAGDLVPLATIGAVLPGGMEIGRRKVRGEVSNGMLCSAAELGIDADASGIHVIDGDHAPGSPAADALGVEHDVVFDLDITANRPDAMSVVGVARDLAARLGVPFAIPEVVIEEAAYRADALATIEVRSPDLCPRFTARVIEGVAIGPAPKWVQRRLVLAGMRPINNVVDASNYVMLELGQPTHPYDLDLVAGNGLVVRAARPGEELTTLDGVTRRLGEGPGVEITGDCLICDAEGEPIGVAGVMGGESTQILPTTTRVLLEAAHFLPMAIARTSKRLGLRTEASARFERGIDPEGIERAVRRFCAVLGNEVAAGMIDVRADAPRRTTVHVRTARVNALLATTLTDGDVAGYLSPIGFRTAPLEPGVLVVDIPSWRPDATGEIDVIEEVARHHGYARIPRSLPPGGKTGSLTAFQHERRRVREVLCGLGLDEAANPPLVGPGDHERAGLPGETISAANAMIREESVLRTSLLPGLLRAVAFNVRHRQNDINLFELGHVFRVPAPDAALPDEREHLALALAGSEAADAVGMWTTLADALRLAPVVMDGTTTTPGLHPGRTVRVLAGGVELGVVGEVDPAVLAAHDIPGRVAWAELDLERVLAAPRRPLEMRPVSRFPSSDIDLAFLLDDTVAAGRLEDALRTAAGDLLVDLRLFDVYRGEGVGPGSRSLAFHLRFQATDRTLTDVEVGEVRAACITAATALGARLRG